MSTKEPLILVIDQSTSSSSAFAISHQGEMIAQASYPLTQHYPQNGWVEHDLSEIWQSVERACADIFAHCDGHDFTGLAITNQRETSVLWDKQTGKALHRAIVWQDRRTADFCEALRDAGHEATITAKTGLLLDPYFSASKFKWLLDNRDDTARPISALACGTIDSWLIWHLTQGKAHLTDATNAARTSLFNIHTQNWDDDLLALFSIPREILPEVYDCAADFGTAQICGRSLPILAVAGDQQAASIGQACFHPGMMKASYGTGCFALVNTGEAAPLSQNRLLTTIAYRLNGKTSYALEGSIFMAGAIVQWLRDELGLIEQASDSEALARAGDPYSSVTMVPAFTGLGAPYWDAQARATISGMTRNSTKADIVRAALESVSLQTHDLIRAIEADMRAAGLGSLQNLRVDGGMVDNKWFVQNLSDITGQAIDRPASTQSTGLGVAYLAMLQAGIYKGFDEISAIWHCAASYHPQMEAALQAQKHTAWQNSVAAILS